MTDKPDPAKDAGRPDSPGAKRPHATLDLKATEVKSPESATASGKPSASSSSPQSSSVSSSASSSAASSKPSSPSGSAPKADAATSGAKSSTKANASGDGETRQRGGVLSHLVAGVLGGAIAYGGVALFGPGGSQPTPSTSELEARLETVETALRETADLGAKLDATESRLAKIDDVEQRVAALNEAQTKLEADVLASSNAGDAASVERVAELEQRLEMIADGAGAADGAVPDLSAITGKLAELEKTVEVRAQGSPLPVETETRLAAALEAGESAKAANERLAREIEDVRSGQSAIARDAGTAKTEVDRLADAFKDVRRETDRLQAAVSDLRASLDASLKTVTRPGDVTAALGPVTSKVAELEQNLGSVVAREDSRRENAERIVLALELANLKRAIGRGDGYAAELAAVEESAGAELDLTALERFKGTGVPTLEELNAQFRPVMNAAIDAETLPDDGSIIDRLMAGAKSVVRVRKVNHDPSDTSAEAVVSRMEAALDAGRLADVIGEAEKLSPKARAPMEDWLLKVTARESVDRAIAGVEERLKASLSGSAENEPESDTAPETEIEAPETEPATPGPGADTPEANGEDSAP